MMRFLILLPCLLICFLSSPAQNKWEGVGIETNLMYGKVFSHTKKFIKQLPDHSSLLEINYVKQTNGKKDWERRRNYPLWGIAFLYTNYGIDSIYGRCFSLIPNLQIPLIRGKNIEWTIKAGFGLGYVTKRYERYPSWDTFNTAIGSHINNNTYFMTDVRYHINKHWDVQAGLQFTHLSNAAYRQPNLGINLYGAHIGARYFPVTSKPERISTEPETLKNRWLAQARLSISATETGPGDGPLYPIYIASAYGSYRYAGKNKLIAGIDYSYHQNIYAFLRNNEISVGEERANSWKSALFAGHEFLVGRVGILFQLGFYIKNPVVKDVIYQKLGGNFYVIQQEKGVLKELYISGLLKTHKEQAELVEVGLGVGF